MKNVKIVDRISVDGTVDVIDTSGDKVVCHSASEAALELYALIELLGIPVTVEYEEVNALADSLINGALSSGSWKSGPSR